MESSFLTSISETINGRPIFLVGMMASGKSKTGPKLAECLNYKFVDLDLLIEKIAKKSISQIFNQDGEEYFRELESKCLREIILIPSLVVSTGGGVVTKSSNWGILRQGIIIWLDLDKDIAIKRLSSESEHRPLLQGQNLDEMYLQILSSRKELYSQADLRIKINNESLEEVLEKIMNSLFKKVNN